MAKGVSFLAVNHAKKLHLLHRFISAFRIAKAHCMWPTVNLPCVSRRNRITNCANGVYVELDCVLSAQQQPLDFFFLLFWQTTNTH